MDTFAWDADDEEMCEGWLRSRARLHALLWAWRGNSGHLSNHRCRTLYSVVFVARMKKYVDVILRMVLAASGSFTRFILISFIVPNSI